MAEATHFIFRARKRRVARLGKFNGLPCSSLYVHSDGKRLVLCDGDRFTAHPDELLVLTKPIHGSPQNWHFDNEGNLKNMPLMTLAEYEARQSTTPTE